MKSVSKDEELRALRVEQAIHEAFERKITWLQAAQHLGLSARQLRRWRRRYQQSGPAGLYDRRRGKPSPRRIPSEQEARVLELFLERYRCLNIRQFHAKLEGVHGIHLSYTWVKTILQDRGLVRRRHRRSNGPDAERIRPPVEK